ncbi:MAG: tetratricopeptide repeat protein [Rhizomicrobium sp.]
MQSSQDGVPQPPLFIAGIEQAIAAGDLDLAAQLAQRALDAGHTHPLLFESRGRCRLRRGQLKDALDDLQRAHALAPKSTRTLCALAECLNALGRPRMAVLACGDALTIDATLAGAWFQKGLAHRQLNQPERAEVCFRQAVRHDPALAPACAELAPAARVGKPAD